MIQNENFGQITMVVNPPNSTLTLAALKVSIQSPVFYC